MLAPQILISIALLSGVTCHLIGATKKPEDKKLFLSKHVVTETEEFEGGVLVDEAGTIEAVLKRDSVELLLSSERSRGWQVIDGGTWALMAGGVDSHVHVNEPGRTSWEGYVSATEAAAAGGITTIIDMPLNSIPPTTTLENLKIKANIAREEIYVDVGFWGGVVPGNEKELQSMIDAGVVGFKCFLIDSGVSEFPYVTPEALDEALVYLNGTGTVLAFHAEVQVGGTTSDCEGPSCPNPDLYDTYLATRPEIMELEAVSLIASQLAKTDVHVHVVHVSAEGVIPILEAARAERIKGGYMGWRGGVTAETCNHYLTLSSEMIPPGHSEFKCAPPIRNITNKQKLWEYIRDERIDLVTSDHSPSVAELKGTNYLTAWGGISSVQFDLSLFWTEAKARGFPLSAVTRYLSAGPARLVGLQESKGSIRPGLDGDLIFFDPDASFLVTPEIIKYKNKMPTIINNSIDTTRQTDGTKMQLESLELAGCTLDRYISADNSRPSFLEITGIASHRSPTCSGLNAGDYRNLAALVNHPSLSQLKILNKVPLPPEIMEHFAHMQCHCLMGVFPEISRVWLAIDSNIYVWAFEHGSDVAYFDGLGETIVSVGLVKPKAGVFQNFVKYLLVLTTTVEIVVLGVTFSSSKNDGSGEFQEIHLVPEPVFVLPTDGISMMCVKSTDKGRIFMGGKDGCLYEITYQAQLGWFGKHCKKVNHSTSTLSFLVPTFLSAALYDEDPIVKIEVDNSRHILYTLSEKGCIEVFDLGPDGEGLSRVVRLTQGKIVSSAFDIVKTLEPNNFKPVVAISAVEESESDHLNLVAVTQTGARLYFSTGSSDATPGGSQRPQYLTLLHVRLPPGFTPNSSVLKPKQVHSAVYENGSLVMVCSAGGGGEAETLWCLSRVLASTSTFSESHTLLALDGPAWALTALPHHHSKHLSQAMLSKKEVWSVSRWAVVTGAGACVVEAGAAPDLLRALLRDCRGPDAHPVKDFFQLYSVEQACACALYLACEDITSGDLSISEWATRAFFLYGSQLAPSPMYQQPSQMPTTIGSPKFSPRQMSTPMSIRGPQGQLQPGKLNQSYQGPMNQSFPGSPNQSMMPQSPFHQSMLSPGFNQSSFVGNMTQQPRDPNFPMPIEYSAKHNGLYIYIGRILAPIWGLKCVTMSQSPDKKEFMSSKVTGEDCAYIVQKLQRVAAFMQRTLAPPHSDEHASLQALKLFITMAIEMLSLWKVLCEHQFHVIAASLPPEQQNALQAASYRELLVGGQEVACLLLGSLVAGYLRDNASVDGISQKLRQLCPTLYRQEDATCSKANELLIFAKQQKNPAEREEMLQHALKLCKDVAPNVNLPLVCSKLVSAGFYTGVVELCVACASKLDPQDKAVHYYKSDQPSQDREGHFIYYRRMEIYREVCSALERLYERSAEASTSEPSPLRSQPNNDNILTMTPADANYQGRKLVWECLSRDDELLHVAVYEWLVSKHLGSELLSLGTAPPASLRTYLQAAARSAAPPAALHLLDLLWKVLEKSGDHLAAANVLEGLATRPGSGATLAQRMSWLSAGVVCVRGAGGGGAGAGGAELLRRLEEAGEVARLQAAVRAAAAALPSHLQPHPHHMQRLDDDLLEITQLYEEYADRYNLWECKLAIVQCSGHNDALLVENIWSNILAEAEAAARNLPSPDERLASVLSKLTSLGREYVNTGHCFPLYFIVRQLEIMSCKLQADRGMVFRTILNIGVSLEQVLDIYIKLVSVNERVWLGCGDESHPCRAAAALLEAARAQLQPLAAPARRRALARCKDLHEAALSALQARPNTQRLIERLSVAQAHLDRMD